eukprot:767051-Hanusia_phi.AAC.7
MMRRQLQSMAGRAKEVTSCSFAAYGAGKLCFLLCASTERVRRRDDRQARAEARDHGLIPQPQVPEFVKSKARQKEETSAKKFFNKIDKDRSGNLTSEPDLLWTMTIELMR